MTDKATITSTPVALDGADIARAAAGLRRFLRRQGVFIVSFGLLVALLAAAASFLSDPLYEAKASFAFERTRNPVMRSETVFSVTAAEAAGNIHEIVVSRPVVEAVVDRLRPHEAERRDTWLRRTLEAVSLALDRWGVLGYVPLRERYVLRWSRRLTVESRGGLVVVGLVDEDPVLAAKVVNAVVDETIERQLAMFTPTRAAKLRSDLVGLLRSDVLTLQAEVPRLDMDPAASRVSRATLAVRLRTLRIWLDGFEREAERLRLHHEPGHPDLAAAEEVIVALRKTHAATESALERADREGFSAVETRKLLKAHLNDYAAEHEALERLRVTEDADRRTVSIRIAAYAEPPVFPVSTRLLSVAGGILCGLAFAAAAALIRDRLDSRVRTPARIAALLRAPVIGEVAPAGVLRNLGRGRPLAFEDGPRP